MPSSSPSDACVGPDWSVRVTSRAAVECLRDVAGLEGGDEAERGGGRADAGDAAGDRAGAEGMLAIAR